MYGEPVTVEGTGQLARCVQHETDHLDGVLFIDRLDPQQRKLAMRAIREAEWWGEPVPVIRASPHATGGQGPLGSLMRLVFAGTPEAAVPALDALLKSRHEVAAVITRPDAPAGRGCASRRARWRSGPPRPASRCSSPAGPASRSSSTGCGRSRRTAAR